MEYHNSAPCNLYPSNATKCNLSSSSYWYNVISLSKFDELVSIVYDFIESDCINIDVVIIAFLSRSKATWCNVDQTIECRFLVSLSSDLNKFDNDAVIMLKWYINRR